MHALIQSAVAALSDWRLLALHLAGNALLFAAAALWLLIPDAHAWQLLVTALGGLALGFAFIWLHCGTLAHGLTPERETLGSDFRTSIRHIPACAVFVVVLIVLMNWASNYSDQTWRISGYFFTRLPHVLQRSVGEVRFHEWVQIKFAVLIWFVLPALFLPFLSAASASGFSLRGLWAALRVYARVKYWLAIAVAALVGILLPHLLANCIPSHGLTKETVSMVLRLITAYVLAILAWLMASAVVGSFLHANLPVENPRGNAAA